MKKKWNVAWWDVLIALGIIALFLWALLKSFGVIHSPIWIEMIPYFSAAIAFTGAVYKVGSVMEVINGIKRDVSRLPAIENRLNKIEYEHNLAMCGRLKVGH